MRRGLAAVCLASIVVVVAPTHAAEPWRPGMKRAIAYSEQRSGSISFAVVGPAGRMYGYRRDAGVPSVSVIKAMFMVAYLRRPSVRDRALRDADRQLLAPMIRKSDDAAASRVADIVGPERINRLAEISGMQDFHYTRPWGSSITSARDQARFFFYLERFIPKRHEDYARYLLSHIVKSQRWGIADINRPNWRLFFKGGWGSGSGATDHQAAFIERGDKRIAVAIMVMYSPSHDYGKETLRGVADRLLNDLPVPR